MPERQRIALEELRQPGMRRILEAMKSIRDETPALFGDKSIAAKELSKGRADAGKLLQGGNRCWPLSSPH
jgi:hypothetical protein